MTETNFLCSYANELDKVVNLTDGGSSYLTLSSPYEYFDYKTQLPETVVRIQDIEESNFSLFSRRKTNNRRVSLPAKPSLLKLKKSGDIVLFIPYTPLIKITKQYD